MPLLHAVESGGKWLLHPFLHMISNTDFSVGSTGGNDTGNGKPIILNLIVCFEKSLRILQWIIVWLT